MKILVITLFSGENEYECCRDSVKKQVVDFHVDHVCVENKPKPEAHNYLYSLIMEKADEYDYFIKLDADMILTSPDSLHKLISYAVDSGADFFSTPVHDYMTDQMIWGLNVYKAGLRWKLGTDNLFTDQQKIISSHKREKLVLNKHSSLVNHASQPTEFQSFVFGVHRAAKVMQKETFVPRISHSWSQLKIILRVCQLYGEKGLKQHGYALIGAHKMLSGQFGRSDLVSKEDYRDSFFNIDYEAEIKKAEYSLSKNNNLILLINITGIVRFGLGAFGYIIKALRR